MTAPKPYQGERVLYVGEGVSRALAEGWSPIAVPLAAVRWFTHRLRPRDSGPYRVVDLRAGDRSVQVSISPTGRSVQVYVDGEQIPKAKR